MCLFLLNMFLVPHLGREQKCGRIITIVKRDTELRAEFGGKKNGTEYTAYEGKSSSNKSNYYRFGHFHEPCTFVVSQNNMVKVLQAQLTRLPPEFSRR